ncbi:Transcription factor TFIIIB component B [Borealophlyctis nickersoniae]|nr:Transcription factor TFIIIB component B [Borealophlyctis nickersoniae]
MELTSSRVGGYAEFLYYMRGEDVLHRTYKGPSKFAPGPKIKPRARARGAASAASGGGGGSSASAPAAAQPVTAPTPDATPPEQPSQVPAEGPPAEESPAVPATQSAESQENGAANPETVPTLIAPTQSSTSSQQSTQQAATQPPRASPPPYPPSQDPPSYDEDVHMEEADDAGPSGESIPRLDVPPAVSQRPPSVTMSEKGAAEFEFAVPAVPQARQSTPTPAPQARQSTPSPAPQARQSTASPASATPEPAERSIPRSRAPPRVIAVNAPTTTPMEVDQAVSRRKSVSVNGDHDDEEEEEEKDVTLMTLAELISSPFSQGKLSKTEEARRAEPKKPRGRKRKREGSVASEASVKAGTPGDGRSGTPSTVADEDEAPLAPAPSRFVPKLIMINGKMQIDPSSLIIEQEAPDADLDSLEQVDEGALRYFTSASFSRKKREKIRWTAEKTETFYEGLSYFGTDFGMIALMFPGVMNRRHVKSKFNIEERLNPKRVNQALMSKKTPDASVREQMREKLSASQRRAADDEDEDETEADLPDGKAATPSSEIAKPVPTPEPPSKLNLPPDEEEPLTEEAASSAAGPSTQQEKEKEPEAAQPAPVPRRIPAPTPDLPPRRIRPPSAAGAAAKPKAGPKIAPKAPARRRKAAEAQPAQPAAEEPSVAPEPEPEPEPETEPEPEQIVPTGMVSRNRNIPTIGVAKKGAAILTPAMRAQMAGRRIVESEAVDEAPTDGLLVNEEVGRNDDAVGEDEVDDE